MSVRNQVTLIGNVGQDPNLQHTKNDTPYCRFSVAVNQRYKKDGETQTVTKWFPITLWGKQAEVMHKLLKKGASIALQGELTPRQEEIDGKKYTLIDIKVNNIELLGSKGGSGGSRPSSDDDDSSSSSSDMDDISSMGDDDL